MTTRACALCGKPAVKDDNKFYPLCGERCHLVDLGKWLGEEYRVPAEPALPGGEDEEGKPR